MGRGRAKAKQTKVARDLKYRTIETDFSQLQRELHGDDSDGGEASPEPSMDGADHSAGYSYDGDYGYDDSESAAR